jgi:hypothetical protein
LRWAIEAIPQGGANRGQKRFAFRNKLYRARQPPNSAFNQFGFARAGFRPGRGVLGKAAKLSDEIKKSVILVEFIRAGRRSCLVLALWGARKNANFSSLKESGKPGKIRK